MAREKKGIVKDTTNQGMGVWERKTLITICMLKNKLENG